MAKAYMPFIKVYWPQKSQPEEKPMRYRVESESKWYKTLRGAKNRAIDARGTKRITVKVVDEQGAVVWTTDQLPKMAIHFSQTEDVTPMRPKHVEPQGDLF